MIPREILRRSEQLQIRLRPHEREMLERAAAISKERPSEFFRRAALAAAAEVIRQATNGK